MRIPIGALCIVLMTVGASAQPLSDDGVVRFVYPDTTARSVALAGEFNGWSATATPLDREGSAWVTRVFLDPGTYDYKFFVDGAWQLDPNNPERSEAGNSLVRVGDDGAVLPARSSGSTTPVASSSPLTWSMRYLGFVTAQRPQDAPRYDLDRPVHDVDLRLDAAITPEVAAWFLANVRSHDDKSDVALRYDRGMLSWTTASLSARLFDHVGLGHFDDPAALVGRVGIYGDQFGFGRRGVGLDRRLLGAPLQFWLADDLDPQPNRVPELPATAAAAIATPYLSSDSERDADTWGFRARGGTDALGIGASFRWDRGAHAGRVQQLQTQVSGDTLRAVGRSFETREEGHAWGVDARGSWEGVGLAAEFIRGRNRARATSATDLELMATPADTVTTIGATVSDQTRFDLDRAHRAVLRLRRAHPAAGGVPDEPFWARPNAADRVAPELRFDYEQHAFEPLVTGTGFTMRRFGIGLGLDAQVHGVQLEADVEHHAFDYPAGAKWETQFWLRRHVFWLDQDVAGVERMPLLGTDRAGIVRLRAARAIGGRVRAEIASTLAAPGFDRAPRLFQNVIRFAVPIGRHFELQAHSRIATYRTFTASDSATVARFGGPGPHFEMGEGMPAGAGITRGYRTYAAHFVEWVLRLSPRADLGLGFGVDPITVYEPTNEYADVGWDAFLFEHGVAPESVVQHPQDLGARVQAAEAALEDERRVSIEVRVWF